MELDIRMRAAKPQDHLGQQSENAGDTEADAEEPASPLAARAANVSVAEASAIR